jgi:hypothetical protein
MKPLKKHPKQQRMEDMKFPGSMIGRKKVQEYTAYPCRHGKTGFDICVLCRDEAMAEWRKSTREFPMFRFGKCFYHPNEPARILSVLQSGTAEYNLCKKCYDNSRRIGGYIKEEKEAPHPKEYLRSINNEHHYWHLLAGLILIGSIAVSAYILSHRLVCAPASFEGKTVINCFRK